MRRVFMVILVLLLVRSGFCQLTKKSHLQKIKQSKLIVVAQDDPILSRDFIDAVREFWTISEIADTLLYRDAIEKVKNDPNYLMLTFEKPHTRSREEKELEKGNRQFITNEIRGGQTLQIIGKDTYKPITRVHIPTFGDGEEVAREIVFFAVSQMESMLSAMDEKGYRSNLQMRKMYNENSAMYVQQKTLLLPREWVDNELTPDVLAEIYGYPIKIAGYKDWRKAIINREPGYIYGMVAPYPMPEEWIYPHFFIDCKTGRVQAVYWPKYSSVSGVSLSGTETGYFNKITLESLANSISEDE